MQNVVASPAAELIVSFVAKQLGGLGDASPDGDKVVPGFGDDHNFLEGGVRK